MILFYDHTKPANKSFAILFNGFSRKRVQFSDPTGLKTMHHVIGYEKKLSRHLCRFEYKKCETHLIRWLYSVRFAS